MNEPEPKAPPPTAAPSFLQVFGWLGLPMVVTFVGSAAVLFFQAYIQLYPTDAANYMMNTTTFDSGEFWLITEYPLSIRVTSALVLIVVGIAYLVLTAFVMGFRSYALARPRQSIRPSRYRTKSTSIDNSDTSRKKSADNADAAAVHPTMFSPPSSSRRQRSMLIQAMPQLIEKAKAIPQSYPIVIKHVLAMIDLIKLFFQTLALIAYLRDGLSKQHILLYATLLVFSWFISFYQFQRQRPDPKLVIARSIYLFDLFFAVFAPMVVLWYSMQLFQFDRAMFQTHLEAGDIGAFESNARLMADPLEVALFRTGFNSLRMDSYAKILVKLLINVVALYDWMTAITKLIRASHESNQAKPRASVLHPRRQLIGGGILFFVFGAAAITYITVAYVTSTANCQAYRAQCPVISYQWNLGYQDCPCRVFIDRRIDPRTYQEWVQPKNITDDLAAMARAGELTIIQIINRQVYPLPEELRRCKNLEQFIFIYTKTDRLPDWMKEFTHMHYFHFEGDYSMAGLSYAPLDMFSTMKNLQFIHTGGIQGLKHYPSLKGLTKLTYLVIALCQSLEELPDLTDLVNLRRFEVIAGYHLTRIPRIAHLKKLKYFSFIPRTEACCNGFVTGRCDLSNFSCLPRDGEKVPVCTDERMPAEDLEVVSRMGEAVCTPTDFDVEWFQPTPFTTDEICNGTLYKQCEMMGAPGICINSRFQVVSCDASGWYEPVRRLQVVRGVGDKCDPEVEAWLGCKRI